MQDRPHYFGAGAVVVSALVSVDLNIVSLVSAQKIAIATPASNIDHSHVGAGVSLPCEYFLIRPRKMPCTGRISKHDDRRA